MHRYWCLCTEATGASSARVIRPFQPAGSCRRAPRSRRSTTGLAPEYRLDEIGQVRRGIWWLVEHARDLGVDSRRITLAGSSAGAHLVLMALLDGWMPAGMHPADVFAGAILLSSVYDLEPVRLTYVNEPLGLDADAAARLSPIRHLPDRLPPLVIARGGAETAEFARQYSDLVKAAHIAFGRCLRSGDHASEPLRHHIRSRRSRQRTGRRGAPSARAVRADIHENGGQLRSFRLGYWEIMSDNRIKKMLGRTRSSTVLTCSGVLGRALLDGVVRVRYPAVTP